MKWSVEKKTLVGLGFASVILVSINALAFWNLRQHKNTSDELVHTGEVLEKLETVSSNLKDAETGQRGYIVTGQERYLKPYITALAKVKPEIQELKRLTVDSPNQQRRLNTLEPLTQEKFAELDQTINLRRDKGFEAAQQVVLTDQGKQVMDKIRTLIQEMEKEERQQQEQSLKQAQTNTQKDTLISTTGILLSFILLYFIYYSLKRELTARRQAEWALQKLNAEIYEALESEKKLNELKSRIITVISHEYRTPLTTILSSAELLERYSHKWAEQRKITHLKRIQSAANHLTDLVGDILDISQVEAGQLDFSPSPLNLESFCRQLVEELQRSDACEHSLTFASLGDCSSCIVDEKLIRQIFTNLLLNAIKYSAQGSTVQFNLRCQGDKVVFQVQDEGIGIPIEDQAQLFKPFERASNVGTISGTGLGLAIVKRLVDLHSGEIAVESAVGVGTTFTVTLPLNSNILALHPA
jgi:signal transduction histidine kinase